MQFKRNVIANYSSQLYSALIGIVVVPLYLKEMGAEAYGLVGFFTMLQGLFQLLDLGLTPTMARETARYNGGATDGLTLRRLLRSLEVIFCVSGILGCGAIILGAGAISTGWVHAQQIPVAEVRRSIDLMALVVALRWMSGLYRGAITGFEKFVWVSGFNVIIATLRFVVVIAVLRAFGGTPVVFFGYQVLIACIELTALQFKTYKLFPSVDIKGISNWDWAPLLGVLRFSLGVAFTSSIWVLVTQTDKLLLSKLLKLSDYAYFTMAVVVAGGITLISGPIGAVLQPRLAHMVAQGDQPKVIKVYRLATRWSTVVVFPAVAVLAFFAESVITAWTGNPDVARKAAPVLSFYAVGNGILAIGAFPYYLQYALGSLRLHFVGSTLFVVWLIPTMIFATSAMGMVGAGAAWCCANLAYFLFWVPVIHKRVAGGIHLKWLLGDILPPAVLTFAAAFAIRYFVDFSGSRLAVGSALVITGLGLFLVALLGAGFISPRKLVFLKRGAVR